MESNDCPILYTKKSEFKNVLVHILDSSNQRSYDDLSPSFLNDSVPVRQGHGRTGIVQTPRSLKVTEFVGRKSRGYGKHDSFFYLQRALEQRERNYKEVDNTGPYEKNL